MKEKVETASTCGEEIVRGNAETFRDFKRSVAKEVDDKGFEFGFLGECL